MSNSVRVIFLIIFFTFDIYASGVPKLIDNNSSIDPLDKDRISNQDTFISPTIQRADVSRDKLLLQGDNLYIGWDLNEGKEIWRNIGNKTQCSDCLPYPELLMFHNEDRTFIRPSYAGGSGVFFGVLMNAILEFDTNTGLFKVVNLKNSGILRKSHDDTKLLIDNENGSIKLFDLKTLQLIAEHTGGKGRWHWGLRYQPQTFMTLDGKKVFQRGEATYDGINCIDLEKNTSNTINGKIAGSYSSTLKGITRNGKIVFLAGVVNQETKVVAYDVDAQRIVYDINLSYSSIRNFFIDKNDKYLYILDGESQLNIFSVIDGRIIRTVKLNGIKTVQPIDHSRYLASLEHGILQILDADFKQVVTLQSMANGEWIIITEKGYFNASSKLGLANVYISEDAKQRLLQEKEIKKYYRPDIVSAILQQKPITDLENNSKVFELAEKAEYVNQYYPSMREMYTKEHNPHGLIILASQKNLDDLKLIEQAIEEANSSDLKSDLYRSMGNFEQKDILPFLLKQLENPKNSSDQVSILSLIKDIDVRVQKVQELSSKKILSEQVMIWVTTWAREKDCILFEPYFWTAIEKNVRIKNEVVINYLIKKDPKRLKNIWIPYAQKTLENGDDFDAILRLKNIIPYLYKLNPTKTITLLTNPKYKFHVYLFEEIRDPALKDILLNHLINKGNIDSKVFNILVSYHDQVVNQKMIDMIQQIDCKKIYKRLKEKIEKDLNITLPCETK